ncbi:MAG: IPT/TIG domain-containing protein [Rubrivivax sp.]|nr:IPT/TIG domain-containing protein [Rubrivivax sp.]
MLAACGGNEGSTPTAAGNGQAPAPAAQPALTITSFTPTTGAAGTVVSVRGTGLDATTSASLGSTAANFRIVSAGELQLTVPAGAATGRVGVSGGGRAAASSVDFVVPAPAPTPAPSPATPAVTTVTPTSVVAGSGRLTLAGSALDQVASARLATVTLPIAAQSATQLLLDVPASAASGTLTLVDRAGTARTVAQPITVLAALAVTGLNPTTLARGQTLTISGRGLDRATDVRFGGGASAGIAGRTGSTALTVVVPGTATSGAVTVLAGVTEQVVSAGSLTVFEPIVVTPQAYAVAATGLPVTVAGTGLAQVNAVQVGSAAAAITSQGPTTLTFTVPAGVTCGALTLRAAGLPDVNAGSVVVGAGCSVRAAGVEFAQVMSQPAGDSYQRLSAGRETWVRAFVVAASAATPAPAVRAVAMDAAGATLGTVTLAGPATLPVLAPAAAVTDAIRYDEAQSFNAELPPAWVRPGLRVRVEVGAAGAPTASTEAAPTVAASGGLRIVLVPLVSGANVPVMPALADVLNELQRRLPLPAGEITVRIRAPYTLTSVTAGVTESAQWSAALSELERLRDTEAPDDQYYGMVKPMVTSGIAGIGYVNTIGSRSPSLASLGWDASRSSWPRTMVHELGHNFSRQHAPCGSVSGADASYPYANGALGPTPLFDVLANDVLSPAGQSDIMGYCNGRWFSDYNLHGVMRFLEARPQALKDVAATVEGDVAGEWIIVSGTVDAAGPVQLSPLRSTRAGALRASSLDSAAGGVYLLRIVTVDGRTIEQRFDATALDHAPGVGHFVLRLPHPGARIARVEVQRERQVLAARAATKDRSVTRQAPSAPGAGGAATPTAGPWAEVTGEGDSLVLQWDAGEWPWASVALVTGSARHVLALEATGGRWRIPAEAWRALPSGGHFEVSLSDGADSTLLVVPRR